MSSAFDIIGFTSTDFDPGFIADVVFGAGGLSAGDAQLVLVLVGNKTAAGTMVADQDATVCFDQGQADTLTGQGSELARMFEWAVKVPGVRIYLAPVLESVGANATLTVTFAFSSGTTALTAGTAILWVAGRQLQVPIAVGDTATIIGNSCSAAILAHPEYGFTGTNSLGVETFTWKQKGPRGNDQIVRLDNSQLPSNVTVTLGGSGTSVAGLGKTFGGGTTADSLTNVATNLFPGWYHRVALAHRDATNLGAWEISMDAKAGWQEQHPQHTVVFFNGSLAAAQSLTQTTLNNARFNVEWGVNQENDPAELAAYFAALRSVTEQSDPGADYDSVVIPGALPYFRPGDNPQRSTRVAALQTGVSPLFAVNGQLTIRRAITTKCLTGTNPDYRTLDVGKAYVPDFIRFDMGLLWLDFKAANPVVADDLPLELGDRPQGVGTPDRWNQAVNARLKQHEAGTTVKSRIPQLVDVDLNPPSSVFDSTPGARRIMSAIPIEPSDRQHQLGARILQK